MQKLSVNRITKSNYEKKAYSYGKKSLNTRTELQQTILLERAFHCSILR